MDNVQERRAYFRIDDTAQIQVRVLDDEEALKVTHAIRSGRKLTSQVLADMLASDDQLAQLRQVAVDRDSPLNDYLLALERKLDTLLRYEISLDEQRQELIARSVSLGGGGLSVNWPEPIPVGSKVEVVLVMLPNDGSVRALAQVAECQQRAGEDGYHLGLNFTVIEPEDRDRIVAHVLTLQAAELRRVRRAVGEQAP